MVFTRCYQEGDRIQIVLPEDHFLKIRLDESMEEAAVFGRKGIFEYIIPTGEEKMAYPPKAFSGEAHKVIVEYREKETMPVNLSRNGWL